MSDGHLKLEIAGIKKKKKKLSKGSGSVFLIESSTINAVPDHRPDFKREGGEKNPKQNKRLWAERPELLPFQVSASERRRLIKKKSKQKKHKWGRSLLPRASAFFWRLHNEKVALRLWMHPTVTSTSSLSSSLLPFVNHPRCERRLIKQERRGEGPGWMAGLHPDCAAGG